MRITILYPLLCATFVAFPAACDQGDDEGTTGNSSNAGTDGDGGTSLPPETDDDGRDDDDADDSSDDADDDPSADSSTSSDDNGGADSTSDDDSSSSPSTGSNDDGSTGDELPPDTDPICVAWGMHAVECGFADEAFGETVSCQEFLHPMPGSPYDTPVCIDSNTAFYTCMVASSCKELKTSATCNDEADAAFNCQD